MEGLQFKTISTEESFTSFRIDGPISGGAISVVFSTIPGNKPNAYGNSLAIWEQGSNPWRENPLAVEVIKQTPDRERGDWMFKYNLEYKEEYILGYCVATSTETDGKVKGLCALAHIPAEGDEYTYEHTSIKLVQAKGNSLALTYQMLKGYSPQGMNDWIGLFGIDDNIYTDAPRAAIPVVSTKSTDTVVFNNISIERQSGYQLGYFMGGWNEDLTAVEKTALACREVFEIE